MTRSHPAAADAALAWPAVGMAAALLALLAGGAPAWQIDWQPTLAFEQPWRLVSAAFVHWSTMHLVANLVGCTVVAALGVVARLPPAATLAWLLAWPLTHLGLLLRPELAHYGGLSGVLHAAVAVAALWLFVTGVGLRRGIGAALLVGLLVKIALEQPWGPALRLGGGWDIATAPLAHATGAVAGLLCAAPLLAWSLSRPRRPRRAQPTESGR